ncbi:phycocyanin alpha phycocyanobilin lyase related protein NblB [Pseudanabaena sp. lw0831]|uniref:HEAT repeat domain-containing protein n=1 Tax=Pseudanabaena sp. lw0831 TaxID=1357935 RepID=UPI0019157162|nr:HEAT repeat domain-containing protein [Pseudanabaena sp. lw0831]GBO55736.1 phycocyanin alpha phycocyanobilin lyase related protein NblB [Pseudanabaena sp. lw0831]
MNTIDSDRLAQLELLFHSESIYDRKLALDELSQAPSDQVVPFLQRLTTSTDFLCRRFAVMGLGNHLTDQSFQVLTSMLEQEQDDNVISEIANTLFEFGDRSIPFLQNLFERNQNWLTRQTILAILMESDLPDILLNIINLALLDPTQTVKETAILALGSLLKSKYESEALDLLTELTDSEFWRDRCRAATTLSISSNPRAKPLLAKLQKDENHYVVAAALEAGLPK